jgi:glycine/D-amino acid oxidase-like deaminating enzyme
LALLVAGTSEAMTDAARWPSASLWASSLPAEPASASERRRDVIVIGAGLTGLVTARVLADAGLDVLVVDRHGIGGVTSRGSTGKLTALQGDLLLEIERTRGRIAAKTYAAAASAGVEGLRRLLDRHGIDGHVITADDHVFATEPSATERARRVHDAAERAGLPVDWIEQSELPFGITGAVRLAAQAHLDPGAVCAGLAASLGPDHLLHPAPVVDVDEEAGGVSVRLEDGTQLRSLHVVIATLGPVHDPALLTTRCEARRSYAIAAPKDDGPLGMYISVDSSARSIRPAMVDGARGVVVAGEGHIVGELGDRTAARRWSELERYAREELGAGGATHRWVAHDLVPTDRIPFIGRSGPGAERRWVATGFQKWGISTAWVAADLLLGEIEGSPRPWVPLFDPRRVAPTVTKRFFEGAVRSVRHLVLERARDLRPGRPKRPRCTHLGCVLSFDHDERTWDCPCHGSRFAEDGSVVCGPASRPVRIRS